jgi:hypothetical protein
MADKPILFSAPMVRAILENRKVQTRRMLKPQPDFRGGRGDENDPDAWGWETEEGGHLAVTDIAPNGYAVGDHLWVRETWADGGDYYGTIYRADHAGDAAIEGIKMWSPSIFMPRWASRITLLVTDVRVQRLTEIDPVDALQEGITRMRMQPDGPKVWTVPGTETAAANPVSAFAMLWDSINAKRPGCSWHENPWVVAITFKPLLCNIDQMEATNAAD